jgi:hypothetical protein
MEESGEAQDDEEEEQEVEGFGESRGVQERPYHEP